MTKITLFWPLILLSSCQWILSHPQEDAEAVNLVEEVAQESYKDYSDYESGRTLSPSQPPLKGPSGPTK